jgi:hypothetical protein
MYTRVARFFLVQTYQIGENIPNDHKLHIPNGHKLYQMALKYSKWSYNIPKFPRPFKIYPNFRFEKPSGNLT